MSGLLGLWPEGSRGDGIERGRRREPPTSLDPKREDWARCRNERDVAVIAVFTRSGFGVNTSITMKHVLSYLLIVITLSSAQIARAATYALCIYERPSTMARRADPVSGPAYWQEFGRLSEEMKAAGVLRGGSALQAGDRLRTVRREKGSVQVSPGAHLPSSLVFSGYFVVEVESDDAALAWAERIPSLRHGGAVEVRPYDTNPKM